MIDLYRQFRQILAELELLSNVSAASYESNGHSIPHSTPPPGVRLDGGSRQPPHEYWRERWGRAVRDDEEWTIERELVNCEEIVKHRKSVIKEAQADLDSYRKRTEGAVVGETERDLEARIVREGEGWSVEQVAQHCRCTVTFARKARLKAGVSTQTGKAPDGVSIDMEDQRQKAREYAENGYTERQIAMLTKLSKSSVRRALGKAA